MESFGPYRVFEQLGEGGMATVHRAVLQGIEGFERAVALKRLRGELADDTSFVRGFVREANLAAQLAHANIAQIYDLGRIADTYYIAMELVPGYDLRRVLRRMASGVGPMPVAIALELLSQMCDALDHAHQHGIVHRDVSPANLIVGHDGVVRVIDFGIARAQSSTAHTQTGILRGKCAYLPPEAIGGAALDRRADLFSLGVVAYELLTARRLFKGATDFATLEQVRHRAAPPPSRANPKVWSEVDEVVLRALAKRPEERWSSAAQMRRAIEDVIEGYSAHVSRGEVAAWLADTMHDMELAPTEPPPIGDAPVHRTLVGWAPAPLPPPPPVPPPPLVLPPPVARRYDAIELPPPPPGKRNLLGWIAMSAACVAVAAGTFGLMRWLA